MKFFGYSHSLLEKELGDIYVKMEENHLYLQTVELMCLYEFQYFARGALSSNNKLAQSIWKIKSRLVQEIIESCAIYFPELKIDHDVLMAGWKHPESSQQLVFIINRVEDTIGRNTRMDEELQ